MYPKHPNNATPTTASARGHSTGLLYALCAMCCMVMIACTSKSKVDNRLVTTYASVLLVRESTVDSVQAQRRFDSVLNVNGYTKASFERELREQSENHAQFKEFYDSVMVRVKQQRPGK